VQYLSFNLLLWGLVLFSPEHLFYGVFFSAGSLVIALYTSYLFTLPIYKLYLKTLRISDKKNNPDLDFISEDLTEEQIGEFSELEQGLDRLQKKLKKRKDQLQREREEGQAFMSSVQEGLINVSLDERVIFFNSRFATLFLDSEKMQIGQLKLTDIFRTPEVYESFKKVFTTGQTQKSTMKMETRLDNYSRNFLVSLTPLRKTKSNEIYGVIGVFHDITDLKKLEQVRIDFVANASHELRSPLTSVKGYVDTLKDDVKKGQWQQADMFLDIISRNVNRLIELVNDLLTLSSLESHGELKLELINPLQISDLVISDLSILAKEKSQVIVLKSLAEPFLADPGKVEQVLRNLIMNAIKYIPNNKKIQIVWENDDFGNTILRVIDDGPGIPQEHHDRLFERFYRIDKGRSRDQGGTGLGLAIVKHIMLSHNGTIQLKSQLGVGSEFICTFPLNEMK
jgi:two-component system phosphate regulon sensor histidine kinase PhoR